MTARILRIAIDPAACVGAGQCVMAAPELFDQRTADGVVVLLQAEPPPSLREAAREAAALCPARAIRVDE